MPSDTATPVDNPSPAPGAANGSTDPNHSPTSVADGWALFNSGDFAAAEAVFAAAVQQNGSDASALDGQAFCLTELGKLSEALQLFAQAYSLIQPGDVEQGINLQGWTIALRKDRRLEDAEARARELLQNFPVHGYGWYLLGLVQFDRLDYAGAASSFRQALAIDGSDVASADKLVDALVEAKQLDEVIPALSQLNDLQKAANLPDRARTLRNWAILLRDDKKLDDALVVAGELVQAFPGYAPGWNTRGLIEQAQHNVNGAIESFREAVRAGKDADPSERVKWTLNFADALRKAGRNEEAVQPYRDLIAIQPEVASHHNGLGIVLEKTRPDEAIAEYRIAAQLWAKTSSPERKYALRNWASMLTSRNELKLAEARLREAIQADPNDADSRNSLAYVLAQSDPDAAIEQCQEAVRLWGAAPDRRYALRLWAESLNAKREFKAAAAKCNEALAIAGDLDSPWIYNALGRALGGQGDYEKAVAALEKARQLTEDSTEIGRRVILWFLGDALLRRERIREALAVYKQAVPLSPANESFGHFSYGCALATAGEMNEALSQYEQAIRADDSHPFAHNNKADLLFRMGRHEEGWRAWEVARQRYEAGRATLEQDGVERTEAERSDAADRAVYYANALRDVFNEYEAASKWYELAVKAHPGHTGAVCGRAILLRRMLQIDAGNTALQIAGGQALRESCELLKEGFERPDCFDYRLVRADLLIEFGDWPLLQTTLDEAEREIEEMRLRRVEVLVRRGILLLATDKPDDAIRALRQSLTDRDSFASMTYLGQALLSAKQHQAALQIFQRVLDRAPRQVEALIGSARACIELADDGDADQYEAAEELLTKSLEYGRQGGSIRLREVDIADVYYMRGYAKTRRCDAENGRSNVALMTSALNDFREAKKRTTNYSAAQSACRKILEQMRRRTSNSIADIAGPVVISVAAAMVFLLAQLDFFFRGTRLHHALGMPAASLLGRPASYVSVTFGALVILIAGISLHKLLKLKVAGVELEKASTDQLLPAAVLNIGRFGILEGFTHSGLRGQGASPVDLSPNSRRSGRSERPHDEGESADPARAYPRNETVSFPAT